jgi:hypothetical protein
MADFQPLPDKVIGLIVALHLMASFWFGETARATLDASTKAQHLSGAFLALNHIVIDINICKFIL